MCRSRTRSGRFSGKCKHMFTPGATGSGTCASPAGPPGACSGRPAPTWTSRSATPPDAAAAEDAGDDEDSFIDDEWLDSPEVMSSVRQALDEVREPTRSAGWISWWRRRYTLTAANALLGALGRLTHGLDSDALILDLDPDDETLAWITETGPGGVGAGEACLLAPSESPQLLSYALASALMPT